MEAIQRLRAVLCDPEGNVCISGSDGDRREITEGLAAVEQRIAELERQLSSVHPSSTFPELQKQLAAAQATISRKDEALEQALEALNGAYMKDLHDDALLTKVVDAVIASREALDIPADRTALDAMLAESEAKWQERAAKYEELLYAVARKFPNETRYETALRYIRQAENQPDQCCAAMAKGE